MPAISTAPYAEGRPAFEAVGGEGVLASYRSPLLHVSARFEAVRRLPKIGTGRHHAGAGLRRAAARELPGASQAVPQAGRPAQHRLHSGGIPPSSVRGHRARLSGAAPRDRVPRTQPGAVAGLRLAPQLRVRSLHRTDGRRTASPPLAAGLAAPRPAGNGQRSAPSLRSSWGCVLACPIAVPEDLTQELYVHRVRRLSAAARVVICRPARQSDDRDGRTRRRMPPERPVAGFDGGRPGIGLLGEGKAPDPAGAGSVRD